MVIFSEEFTNSLLQLHFLTKDAPTVANKSHMKNSLTKKKPKTVDQWKTPDMDRMGPEPENDLTDEEISELKRQIAIELREM